MKLELALILSIGCGALSAAGDTSQFGSVTNPQPEIIWATPTNDWPEKVWIYKIVPQEIPPAVISNLLTIGGFTEKDRTKVPKHVMDTDDRAFLYGDLEGTVKHLLVCPKLGYIDYSNPKAEASSQLQKVEGVPTETGATQLGMKYLRLLGIDIGHIATKPNGELDLRWQKRTITFTDQATKTEVVLTNSYGVIFARRVDGIKVHGFGGVDIRFGNNAKVVSLQMLWRNLQPYELKGCFTLEEIGKRIKNGNITLHPRGSKAAYSPKTLSRLIITKATPLYEGKNHTDDVQYVRPYGNFQGVVEDGTTKTEVWFECSILEQ